MSKGHGLREESVSLFYHLRFSLPSPRFLLPSPRFLLPSPPASYSPPYLPAIFAQSLRNLPAIFSQSFRNLFAITSACPAVYHCWYTKVPQLVLAHMPCYIASRSKVCGAIHPAVSSPAPCGIVPCTLRHRPLEFRPPLPLSSSVAVRSAAVMPQPPLPAPPRPRCMQNRISKTLLTLLIKLIYVKRIMVF